MQSAALRTLARVVALLWLASAPLAAAERRPLTLDDAMNAENLSQAPQGLTWLDDDHYAWQRRTVSDAGDWLAVDASTGKTARLFDRAAIRRALLQVPGATAEEAASVAESVSLATDASHRRALLILQQDLFMIEPATARLTRLTSAPGLEEEAAFSPDGRQVAFVRANDLYVVDVATAVTRRLTGDGSDEVLNGKLDWLYQEEIYGRGQFRGFWWSPDSRRLAFLQLQERGVPRYTLVDEIPGGGVVHSGPYPKAADPNPGVRLGTVAAAGGPVTWLFPSERASAEILIVGVAFAPGGQVHFQVQDREQTWLELMREEAGPRPRTLLRETTRAWVCALGNPLWLRDGSFLWLSERSGFKHLYHYRADGRLIRPLTQGAWEVQTLHGVDEHTRSVYFSGTERSPLGLDAYRITLDGSGLRRLTSAPGTHKVAFSPAWSRFLDTWSDLRTPPQVRLHRADGGVLRVIHDAGIPALESRLGRVEHVQVRARDGFALEGLLFKPFDFDPGRRYPVFQHTYGGPQSPEWRDRWGGVSNVQDALFFHLLAQQGVIVWVCDNRSASGKGAQSAWPAYQRLGESELDDIEDGVTWLKQQPWVDPSRIGISGWSYGGFLVAYALTHSRSFAIGIAGGPVVDWRNYDSVYANRLLGTPQRNPEAYRKSAPLLALRDLHGELLLLHGLDDDNVHPQHTVQMAYELQRLGKRFELMTYARSDHTFRDPALIKHRYATMLAFIERTLLARPAS